MEVIIIHVLEAEVKDGGGAAVDKETLHGQCLGFLGSVTCV